MADDDMDHITLPPATGPSSSSHTHGGVPDEIDPLLAEDDGDDVEEDNDFDDDDDDDDDDEFDEGGDDDNDEDYVNDETAASDDDDIVEEVSTPRRKRAKRQSSSRRSIGSNSAGAAAAAAASSSTHAHGMPNPSGGRLRFTDLELSLRTEDVLDDRHHRPADMEKMIAHTQKRRFKKRGVRSRKNALPSRFINVMGEANKAYTRQAYDVAKRLCQQVVDAAPDCPDPYDTLALVCEEVGDKPKCFEYRKKAASCRPMRDVNWMELAGLAMEIGRDTEASRLLQRAHKLHPDHLPTLEAMMAVAEKQGKTFQVVRYCGKYISKCGPNVQLFNRLYKLATQRIPGANVRFRCLDEAADSMLHVLEKAKAEENPSVDAACVLMTVDLLSQANRHKKCCVTLVPNTLSFRHLAADANHAPCQACFAIERGVSLDNVEALITRDPKLNLDERAKASYDTTRVAGAFEVLPVGSTTTSDGFHIPDGMKLYFRVRLALAHLALNDDDDAAVGILLPLLLHSVEQHYALFHDTISVLISIAKFHLALRICEKVRRCEKWDKPALWVLMSRCYKGLHEYETAREHIDHVLKVVPMHKEALRLQREICREAGVPLPQSQQRQQRTSKKKRSKKTLTIISNNSIPTEQQLKDHGVADGSRAKHMHAATTSQRTLTAVSLRGDLIRIRQLFGKRDLDAVISTAYRPCLFFLQSQLQPTFLRPFRPDVCRQFVIDAAKVDWQWEAVRGAVSGETGNSWLVYDRDDTRPDGEHLRVFNPKSLSIDEWFEMFIRVSEAMVNRRRGYEAACMLRRLIHIGRWGEKKPVILYLETLALLGAGCYDAAYLIGRANVLAHSDANRLWAALYPLFFQTHEALHANRFVLRRLREAPKCPSPFQAQANHSLMSSTYNYAAFGSSWSAKMADNKDDRALAHLTHSIACLRRTTQRSCPYRRPPLIRALVLFNDYAELRGGVAASQEAAYNLARLYHFWGVNHLAVPAYRRALALPSVLDTHRDEYEKEKHGIKGPFNVCSEAKYASHPLTVLIERCLANLRDPSSEPDPTNLRAECAFNIALIHKPHSPEAAGRLLRSTIAW
ncbi:hypothetical protein PTSG_03440 [Salpingoeca rosetta]|uniref:Uncharacterized protein n=1 Tax=Salpingoeca rosetta (strain ATCC 50818 / BSB-021) TaxID=946362 RepID=F2U574_SALR5|nr:uncharacterized protein PTSG_03440 [Salpingoeca rosetta]EGD82790.1 hypothetical protein PTSG_03440 [Salpingoeca rosetta]|eukprot:XP_004996026.1 hypothetical protein PTSG_03440 [Salpingoeca rosetta]